MASPPPLSPPILAEAEHLLWLERLLKPGMSLTQTRSGHWYVKCWDSWTVEITSGFTEARMGYRAVDSDQSLAALLGRLENR